MSKDNGKDNDNNGWAADIHGWNFLGNSKGESWEIIPTQTDREFLRLHNKYDGIFFTGTRYVRFDKKENKPVVITEPIDKKEYQYFRNLGNYTRTARLSAGYQMAPFMQYYLTHDFDEQIKKKYPDTNAVTAKEFAKLSLTDENGVVDSLKLLCHAFLYNFMSISLKSDAPPITYPLFKSYYLKRDSSSYTTFKAQLKAFTNGRSFVGDDENNILQKGYGNNNLLANSSYSSVLSAGVIAAARNNNLGIDGIAPQARLMGLRVYDTNGETFLKDLALAITYAVDHKADIIMLGSPYKIYPPHQSQWVDDALAYAEKKVF
ncbi:MAG: hypothetical protein EOP48_25955 [Sphingobacteriales bacterium]|nr:MAG: hypothetical protein EOP48_25955 [Sphingobacteriales bacterium]